MSTLAAPDRGGHPGPASAAACFAIACLVTAGAALALGQDANWDLQNYHYYTAWAWWHGRTFGPDLGAAQVQTYHNPLLHLPFFAMVSAQWPPRLIAIVLTLPAAWSAFVVAMLARALFANAATPERWTFVTAAVVIGMTSAMGVGALGNTMGEWVLAACVLTALWCCVGGIESTRSRRATVAMIVVAGIVAGLATGLKLTAGTPTLALCLALAFRGPWSRSGLRTGVVQSFWFATGVVAGAAASYGGWGLELWRHFGNPVFPYFNHVFASPWWESTQVPQPHAYGPGGLLGWLAFPFILAAPPLFMVAEVPFRDPRLAAVTTLAILAAVVHARRRPAPAGAMAAQTPREGVPAQAWRLLALFAAMAFVLWAYQHAIYRYLLVVDALSGLLAVGLVRRAFPGRLAAAAAVVLTLMLVAATRPADWGRVPFGERWFEPKVRLPQLAPDALVLVTTGEAVAYLIPLLGAAPRYVAALNTLVHPDRPTRLTQEVDAIVRDHRGSFYQLTFPLTEGREVIAAHGLARTQACAVIVTNMPTSPIELCRLVRRSTP